MIYLEAVPEDEAAFEELARRLAAVPSMRTGFIPIHEGTSRMSRMEAIREGEAVVFEGSGGCLLREWGLSLGDHRHPVAIRVPDGTRELRSAFRVGHAQVLREDGDISSML